MASERFVEVGGRRLWTRVAGEGRTVLLCPGGGAAGVGYAPQIEEQLAGAACLVTYDRAGLGRSDPPAAPPTVEDMVRDMAGVVDALGLPFPMLLVGFSLAALPVQLFACRRPAEVHGLLLLDPTPDEMVAAMADWPEDLREVARRNLRSGPNVTPAMAMELETMVESAIVVRDAVRAQGLPDVPLVVAAIDRPSGAAREHHEAMARRAPRGRFLGVPGDGAAGHADFMRDNPALIVDLIRQMMA